MLTRIAHAGATADELRKYVSNNPTSLPCATPCAQSTRTTIILAWRPSWINIHGCDRKFHGIFHGEAGPGGTFLPAQDKHCRGQSLGTAGTDTHSLSVCVAIGCSSSDLVRRSGESSRRRDHEFADTHSSSLLQWLTQGECSATE